MRISLLKVENFQRVESISIEPGDRNLILIAGKNRQGKSSLLRAMSAALGGGKEKPDRPIREGESVAEIVIELDGGELVISKKFSLDGKASLDVRSKLGKLGSPQKILDGIVGTRFLDPLAFTRLTEREQRDKLLEVVDLAIDLDDHAAQRRQTFDHRTHVNRDVKRLKAELGAFEEPGEIPAKMDLNDLLTKLETLRGQAADAADAEDQLAEGERQVRDATADVERLEEELGIARATLFQVTQSYDELREDLSAVATIDVSEDIAKVNAELAKVDEHNAKVTQLESAKASRERTAAALNDAEILSEQLDSRLRALDGERCAALLAARMPVAGLSLDESAVLFNNIPLSQASGAEQLQVSLAIAASTRPELSDIWIEDGALLDSDSLKLVSDFANERGLRVWLERVGDADDDCIVIEEGSVRASKAVA